MGETFYDHAALDHLRNRDYLRLPKLAVDTAVDSDNNVAPIAETQTEASMASAIGETAVQTEIEQ